MGDPIGYGSRRYVYGLISNTPSIVREQWQVDNPVFGEEDRPGTIRMNYADPYGSHKHWRAIEWNRYPGLVLHD